MQSLNRKNIQSHEKVYDSMSHRKYQSNTLCECNYLLWYIYKYKENTRNYNNDYVRLTGYESFDVFGI